METKHTPEPWQWTQTGVAAFAIIQPDGHSIVHCETLLNSTAQRLMEANARRIVACVNACAGISVNELTHGPVIALNKFSYVVNERDELAAALREAVDAFADAFESDDAIDGGDCVEWLGAYREHVKELLAKVQS